MRLTEFSDTTSAVFSAAHRFRSTMETKLAFMEKDRLCLFGAVLARNATLIGSCWAAEITTACKDDGLNLEPLHGIRLTIDEKPYWGLCGGDAISVVCAAQRTLLALPVVPSVLGRWAHAPHPLLLESIACMFNRIASVECVPMYVMGSAVVNPPATRLGWSKKGEPLLLYQNQFEGELQRSKCEHIDGKDYPLTVAPASGNNIFVVCFVLVLNENAGKSEKRNAIKNLKKVMETMPRVGKLVGTYGNEKVELLYRHTHLGPDVCLSKGWVESPSVTVPRDAKLNVPACRVPCLMDESGNAVQNTNPYMGDHGRNRSLSECWRYAWFDCTPVRSCKEGKAKSSENEEADNASMGREVLAKRLVSSQMYDYNERDDQLVKLRKMFFNKPPAVKFLDDE